MFFEEEVEKENLETELDVKEREKVTHRKRREFSKREKSKQQFEDRFDKLKSKKRPSKKRSQYDYEMED